MFNDNAMKPDKALNIARILNFLGLSKKISERDSFEHETSPGKQMHSCSESGGYNEAFILQAWASYGPHH